MRSQLRDPPPLSLARRIGPPPPSQVPARAELPGEEALPPANSGRTVSLDSPAAHYRRAVAFAAASAAASAARPAPPPRAGERRPTSPPHSPSRPALAGQAYGQRPSGAAAAAAHYSSPDDSSSVSNSSSVSGSSSVGEEAPGTHTVAATSGPARPNAQPTSKADFVWPAWLVKLPGLEACFAGDAASLSSWSLPPAHSSTVSQFLGKLKKSREYQSVECSADKTKLASFGKRLGRCLAAMRDDSALADLCIERMQVAVEPGCTDRILWHLREIELVANIYHAERAQDPGHSLRTLATGLIRLQVAQNHAAKAIEAKENSFVTRSLGGYDEAIGIYSIFDLAISRLPASPLPAMTPFYEEHYRKLVGSQAIQAAVEEAKARSSDAHTVEDFLASWDPWQRFLRREYLADKSQQRRPERAVSFASADEPYCVFTLVKASELAEPLCREVDGSVVAFESEPFLRWWASTGSCPITRQPLCNQELRLFVPAGGRINIVEQTPRKKSRRAGDETREGTGKKVR